MLQDDDLYGQHTIIYRAITDSLQEMSGIKTAIEGAFPSGGMKMNFGGTNLSLAEGMSMLSSSQFAELNSMLANMENKVRELGKQFNLPDTSVEHIANQTWGYGAMLADARDAKTERVKVLIDLLKSDSTPTRVAASLSLVWYADPTALLHLEQSAQDSDAQVQRAAAWAHQALKKTLGYLKDMR